MWSKAKSNSTDGQLQKTMYQPDPTFPPLLRGEGIEGTPGPFDRACADAAVGEAGAGSIYWDRSTSDCRLAIVLEPEIPAAQSLQMLFVLMVAFGDAFGAIGPPEVGIFYRWPMGFVVNDALIGWTGAALPSSITAEDVPDWLVVGLDIRISRTDHDAEPGHELHNTTLEDEGGGDITRTELVESISRHFLVWAHNWSEDGFKPVHDAWLPRSENLKKEITVSHGGADHSGLFLGIDDRGNMLLKPDEGEVISLSLFDIVKRI